jgi:hypothetical protein
MRYFAIGLLVNQNIQGLQGLHGSRYYVNCGKILEYPSLALLLAANNVLHNVQVSSKTPNERDVAYLADQKAQRRASAPLSRVQLLIVVYGKNSSAAASPEFRIKVSVSVD